MKNISLIALSLFAAIFFTQTAEAKDMLQIKGSDTLINMVQKLAEEYMQKNNGKAVAVTGGGSGTGIAALINGSCDIANASRLMKPKEVEDAVSKGRSPKRVVVAIDGLSIAVNASNPVKKLTVEQIGKIYRGEVTNWQDVGGNNSPITVYGRQSNSGTYEFMKDFVMKGEYTPKMRQMNGSAQIIEALKQDATGIGYVGVGYVKNAEGITVLNVASSASGEYVSPLDASNVKSGIYPISRPLNQYINGTPDKKIKDFILFELGQEGQKLIEEEGFFSIPEEYRKMNNEVLGV